MKIYKGDHLPDLERHMVAIDSIFFESSARQEFADQDERNAFRERWLGRYIEKHRDSFFVAIDDEGTAIGYLAGCLQDPTRLRHFDDIAYFKTIASLCREYPAHLHINMAAGMRSKGVGAALIERFVEWARQNAVGGVHVVTAQTARSVPFYQRCGFVELKTFPWNSGIAICLGRKI
jgi:GNAT superfamily N-acetyltransferase